MKNKYTIFQFTIFLFLVLSSQSCLTVDQDDIVDEPKVFETYIHVNSQFMDDMTIQPTSFSINGVDTNTYVYYDDGKFIGEGLSQDVCLNTFNSDTKIFGLLHNLLGASHPDINKGVLKLYGNFIEQDRYHLFYFDTENLTLGNAEIIECNLSEGWLFDVTEERNDYFNSYPNGNFKNFMQNICICHDVATVVDGGGKLRLKL